MNSLKLLQPATETLTSAIEAELDGHIIGSKNLYYMKHSKEK
jgi:hypothetical protein